jgi:hypothetical protein
VPTWPSRGSFSPSPQALPVASGGAVRFLNLHEYQSKDLLEKFGVQVRRWPPRRGLPRRW